MTNWLALWQTQATGNFPSRKRHSIRQMACCISTPPAAGRSPTLPVALRFAPIGERAIEWLQTYQEEIRPGFVMEPDSQKIFIEPNGLLLTPDRLSRLATKYIKQADVGKTGSCHLFLHTVATLMLGNGAGIRFIQQILGHAHLQTTEIYTHVSIVKLKQIHAMTHPAPHQKTTEEGELEVTEEELLATLGAEEAKDKI